VAALIGRLRSLGALAPARWLRVAPFVAMAAIAADPASAEMSALERQVKAAYLYKFGSYVEWPMAATDSARSDFVIGVTGDDALAAELERLVAGRTMNGRRIVVRSDERSSLKAPHILFVGRSRLDVLDRWRLSDSTHTLIVTDMPGALRRGSMINFVLVDGNVRFEISLASAERARLALSSRLLSVAQTVSTRSR
jgi:hypothetical protein